MKLRFPQDPDLRTCQASQEHDENRDDCGTFQLCSRSSVLAEHDHPSVRHVTPEQATLRYQLYASIRQVKVQPNSELAMFQQQLQPFT